MMKEMKRVLMKEEILSVIEDIKRERSVSGSTLVALNRLGGERFWKALKAVTSSLVKRYLFEPSKREVWVIVGKNRDYLVSDFYCDCDDFYFNCVIKRRAKSCYHILAKLLAEALGLFSDISVGDDMYDTLREEWQILPQKR
jgi:predicted nucleic acid-binding Zn finger protein